METIKFVDNFNSVYKNKKILITGHTGFKGSWLTIWLTKLGAKVIGYSLEEYENDYIFDHAKLSNKIMADERGNIKDFNKVNAIFEKYQPEFVFHLAAQPLVRQSYKSPLDTYQTNVLGTINILECIRLCPSVKNAVIITTDKVYKNKEKKEPYKETDELGGFDPYSTSKACAELAISSYKNAFYSHQGKKIASVRGGNVIGGGDWSKNRLFPDCVKYLQKKEPIPIRNPSAIRPWQHVLDLLDGYLFVGANLLKDKDEFAQAWNFAPEKEDCIKVNELADLMIKYSGKGSWTDTSNPNENMKETCTLLLDNSSIKKQGWSPLLNINETIKWSIDWYNQALTNDIYTLCSDQINNYSTKKSL
jgi:CDP-glucose 4,6-dehydratase